jgi:purine-binding chemotaxis protein CheW
MNLVLAELVSRHIALPLSSVKRVVLRPNLIILPEQPLWVAGWLKLGSSIVPAIDLSALMQESKQSLDLYSPLIVVSTDRGLASILVSKVLEVCQVDPSQLQPLQASDTFLGVASAVWMREDQAVSILTPGRIFTTEERRRLDAWEQVALNRAGRLA